MEITAAIISAISSGASGIVVTTLGLGVRWIRKRILKGKYDSLKLGGVEKILEEEKIKEREELRKKIEDLVEKVNAL